MIVPYKYPQHYLYIQFRSIHQVIGTKMKKMNTTRSLTNEWHLKMALYILRINLHFHRKSDIEFVMCSSTKSQVFSGSCLIIYNFTYTWCTINSAKEMIAIRKMWIWAAASWDAMRRYDFDLLPVEATLWAAARLGTGEEPWLCEGDGARVR
jgi:hypothetical protein